MLLAGIHVAESLWPWVVDEAKNPGIGVLKNVLASRSLPLDSTEHLGDLGRPHATSKPSLSLFLLLAPTQRRHHATSSRKTSPRSLPPGLAHLFSPWRSV